MSQKSSVKRDWKSILGYWKHPRALTMLFLGFSAGLPLLLIFSSLSLWLKEAGVAKSAVTFFSWAALGFSFKFIWAPLIDMLPLPILTRFLGRRRAWLLTAQLLIITAICWMASVDPSDPGQSLTYMALAAVMLGFSAATQDIVIDAYRIESAEKYLQAMLASMYIAGYRIGMLVSGAGALYLATWFGSVEGAYLYSAWKWTYYLMAAVMLVGVVTTLTISEPDNTSDNTRHEYTVVQYGQILIMFMLVAAVFAFSFFHLGTLSTGLKSLAMDSFPLSGRVLGFMVEFLRFSSAVLIAAAAAWTLVMSGLVDRSMVNRSYIHPVKDFFLRYGLKPALLLIVLIGCYRISDIVLGVISNLFYADVGFSKNEIATISKSFGLGMTILGGFLGGFLTIRYGVFPVLFLGALLSAATNLLFMVLAGTSGDLTLLTLVIAADNLSGGLATTAFVAFLSALTNISFTATQYAIFSSLMTLLPKLIGGYSGTMVSSIGYETFFLITAIMGLPVLLLVWMARGMIDID